LAQPSASREFVPVREINPRRYIPEICAGMLSLHNSVMSLKPFSTLLGEIWTVVDSKADATKAETPSHDLVHRKVLDLHQCLKTLSPMKVNSLVFVVVQKYTTLLSTFFRAITNTVPEAFVTRERS
jgi:hypothetical protein